MPLRLGFDVDGVLADFRSAFRATARECLGHAGRRPTTTATSRSPLSQARRRKGVGPHRADAQLVDAGGPPHEPAEIARLYALARAARWEVFFLTKRPRERWRPGPVPDPVVARTAGLLPARSAHRSRLSRRARQLAAPRSRGRRSDRQLRRDHRCGTGQDAADAPRLRSALAKHATDRGIGVVTSLAEALPAVLRLQEILPTRIGKPLRLMDWFTKKPEATLPLNPRLERPLPE